MTRPYHKCPILEANRRAKRLEMATLYREGKSLREIGDLYGVTGEAIRQHLVKVGITSGEGGKAIWHLERRSLNLAKKDEECLRRYGCTTFQLRELRRLRLPVAAYKAQKSSAIERGIEWKLNLWQWWSVWQESGHWPERGREVGQFVMCRHGDDGPYAIGNIYIATCTQNILDGYINRGFNPERSSRRRRKSAPARDTAESAATTSPAPIIPVVAAAMHGDAQC